MHTDRCGNTCRQKCCAKGSGKEVKTQEFVYRDTTNVEPEMYDCTSNNWSHWNSKKKFKEKFGHYTRTPLDRFTTKDSLLGTSHIIRNVLQCEAWSLSGGDHRWLKRSSRKKCLWRETYISYNNNKNYNDLMQFWALSCAVSNLCSELSPEY